MNPFYWSGPAFLLFYSIFGMAMLVIQWRLWKRDDSSKDAYIDLTQMASDPYRIAYLRDGLGEAVKVATISLIDRGLLKQDQRELKLRDLHALKAVQRPIEREVLRQYYSQKQVYILPSNELRLIGDGYRDDLVKLGLLIAPQEKRNTWIKTLIICVCLLAISLIKMDIAIATGHYNILFLVLLTAAFIGLIIWLGSFVHRTAAGSRLLGDLRTFFSRLSVNADNINPGGETNEATLVAAIYGMYYLPQSKFPFIYQLYPRPTATDSGSSSSNDSSGSGCGSGGGSSCGSSCGGGCGGCGGGD